MWLIEAIKLRWQLWRVCRKLGIKPYKFQRQFALTGRCKWPTGRCQGKTMAVMLYGLIRNITLPSIVYGLAWYDPDCRVSSYYSRSMRREWFVREYNKLRERVIGDDQSLQA